MFMSVAHYDDELLGNLDYLVHAKIFLRI